MIFIPIECGSSFQVYFSSDIIQYNIQYKLIACYMLLNILYCMDIKSWIVTNLNGHLHILCRKLGWKYYVNIINESCKDIFMLAKLFEM